MLGGSKWTQYEPDDSDESVASGCLSVNEFAVLSGKIVGRCA